MDGPVQQRETAGPAHPLLVYHAQAAGNAGQASHDRLQAGHSREQQKIRSSYDALRVP